MLFSTVAGSVISFINIFFLVIFYLIDSFGCSCMNVLVVSSSIHDMVDGVINHRDRVSGYHNILLSFLYIIEWSFFYTI